MSERLERKTREGGYGCYEGLCYDGRGCLRNAPGEINVTRGPDTSPGRLRTSRYIKINATIGLDTSSGRIRTSRYINLGTWVIRASSGMSERLDRKPREGGYGCYEGLLRWPRMPT